MAYDMIVVYSMVKAQFRVILKTPSEKKMHCDPHNKRFVKATPLMVVTCAALPRTIIFVSFPSMKYTN